jgi:acyl dehydratase
MADSQPSGNVGLLYFDDLQVGQRFTSGPYPLDAQQIRDFAQQFDPQPFHLDAEAAKKTLFDGLAASGWHTAALTMRLLVKTLPIAGGVVGLGGEIRWPKPARPGDEFHLEIEVVELRASRSQNDRGIAKIRSETVNEHGEVVQELVANLLVPRNTVATQPQAI